MGRVAGPFDGICSQCFAVNLPCGSVREMLSEKNLGGYFILRQMDGREIDELSCRNRGGTLLEDHMGLHQFVPKWVGHSEDGCLQHRGMLIQNPFDFDGRDQTSLVLDNLRFAADKPIKVFLVFIGKVAGAKPSLSYVCLLYTSPSPRDS